MTVKDLQTLVIEIRELVDELRNRATNFGGILKGIEGELEDWGVPFYLFNIDTETYIGWERYGQRMRICYKSNEAKAEWEPVENMPISRKLNSDTYQLLQSFLLAWKNDLATTHCRNGDI